MSSEVPSPAMRREITKDMIACAECRFREALRAMKVASPTDQLWMHAAIIKELVSRHHPVLAIVMNYQRNYSILP
jgi:hypothetical protein